MRSNFSLSLTNVAAVDSNIVEGEFYKPFSRFNESLDKFLLKSLHYNFNSVAQCRHWHCSDSAPAAEKLWRDGSWECRPPRLFTRAAQFLLNWQPGHCRGSIEMALLAITFSLLVAAAAPLLGCDWACSPIKECELVHRDLVTAKLARQAGTESTVERVISLVREKLCDDRAEQVSSYFPKKWV